MRDWQHAGIWDLLACAAETFHLANEVCPGSASEAEAKLVASEAGAKLLE
jgi:hypothetical protein